MSRDDLFEGHPGRDCGHHRTVGPHRAWCFDCGEWCYPDESCARCELPRLRAQLAKRGAPPELITLSGTDFRGCTDSNSDNCACETWRPVECSACAEEMHDGEQAFTMRVADLPWLPVVHPEQEFSDFYWHPACDRREQEFTDQESRGRDS
jgi:hypothetical protein